LYNFKGRAEENTNDLDKNAARIQNNLLGDSSDAVEAKGNAIANAVKDALSGATITMANGTITFQSKATIQKNATTAAKERQRLDAIPS